MKRVMLVEDEELILQGIRYINDWQSMGMQVVHMAHNGIEALEMLKKQPVDIIVTDIEMPEMNGIELISNVRKIDNRVRFLILSGQDDFNYARDALKLDVEDYILKPINEQQLQDALINTSNHLDEIDQKNSENERKNISWLKFLSEKLDKNEKEKFCNKLPDFSGCEIYPAILRVDLESLQQPDDINIISKEICNINFPVRIIYLTTDVVLLILQTKIGEEISVVEKTLTDFQNEIESKFGILSFITIGNNINSYDDLPRSYQNAYQLQKYRILSGYGNCISPDYIINKRSRDVAIDQNKLRKIILNKNQDEVISYLDDIFIGNLQDEVNVDVPYQIVLKIIMLLEEIKVEYKLEQNDNGLSKILDNIYQAKDIFALRTMLVLEISGIINELHAEKSQYTPVVRQVMKEIQDNYKEDMNLKTLSYKYNMNTSYLGQIFQKEVGCTFNQYLSNTKIEKARELILHTNMKISDISKEVGYPDTSYFYRKFKQHYGISPASLRNMKKY